MPRVINALWRSLRAPPLPEQEIARRMPVWIALSELFLDTETQGDTFAHIARTLDASGYDRVEQFRILVEEVTPAFGANMFDPAGVWDFWPDEQVRRRVLAQVRRPWQSRWLGRALLHDIDDWWARIEAARAAVSPAGSGSPTDPAPPS